MFGPLDVSLRLADVGIVGWRLEVLEADQKWKRQSTDINTTDFVSGLAGGIDIGVYQRRAEALRPGVWVAIDDENAFGHVCAPWSSRQGCAGDRVDPGQAAPGPATAPH